MGRTQVLNVTDKAARARQRKVIGHLRDNQIVKGTLKRYSKAVLLFLTWVETHTSYPASESALDELLCTFAEELWQEGESRSILGDVLSGLGFYFVSLKGRLKAAWRLYGTWGKLELPVRAVPFTIKILRGCCGLALEKQDIRLASALWLGFQALLRTGELVKLTMSDIEIFSARNAGCVRLGLTKGGRRRGETESVYITDVPLLALLSYVKEQYGPGTPLVSNAKAFRIQFANLLRQLHLDGMGFLPYSLRRGGASHLFLQTGDMSIVQARGRWQNLATAKLYVDECVAVSREFSLTAQTEETLSKHEQVLRSYFM